MIEYDVTITSDCDRCGVKIKEFSEHIFCDKCVDYEISESNLKEALVDIADKFWTDNYKNQIGFTSKLQKDFYFRAFKNGVADTLFWICDEFDLVPFFEQKIGHNLENTPYKVDGGLPDLEYDEEYEKQCEAEEEERQFRLRNTP